MWPCFWSNQTAPFLPLCCCVVPGDLSSFSAYTSQPTGGDRLVLQTRVLALSITLTLICPKPTSVGAPRLQECCGVHQLGGMQPTLPLHC